MLIVVDLEACGQPRVSSHHPVSLPLCPCLRHRGKEAQWDTLRPEAHLNSVLPESAIGKTFILYGTFEIPRYLEGANSNLPSHPEASVPPICI